MAGNRREKGWQRRRGATVPALVLALILVPTPFSPRAMADEPSPLTVAAASSLTEAVSLLATAYRKATGADIRISFAASSVLTRQLIQGAPIDVLMTAHTSWMDHAVEAGVIMPDSVTPIAGNRLVIIAGPLTALDDGLSPRTVLDRADVENWRIATADPDHVPAGFYAREALISLGSWSALRAQLVPLADVRAAVAFVARGETAIGFAYGTDVRASPAVREVAAFDGSSHAPIRYVAGLSDRSRDGEAFIAFALSDAGRAILSGLGFSPPGTQDHADG